MWAGAGLLLLFGWALVSTWRRERQFDESERLLAESACHACGAQYGTDAARQARFPEREPGMIYDDFGYWVVRCPACGVRAHFHSEAREFFTGSDDAS